jgi:hypothetical protein
MKILSGCLSTFFAIVVLSIVSIQVIRYFPSIKVEVMNLGSSPMKDVAADFNDFKYPIGDIPAGATKSTRMRVHGDQSFEISYVDQNGQRKTLHFENYLQRGDFGKITLQVKNGKIVDVTQTSSISPCEL